MWCCSGPSRVCPLPFWPLPDTELLTCVLSSLFLCLCAFCSQELLLCYSLAGNTEGHSIGNFDPPVSSLGAAVFAATFSTLHSPEWLLGSWECRSHSLPLHLHAASTITMLHSGSQCTAQPSTATYSSIHTHMQYTHMLLLNLMSARHTCNYTAWLIQQNCDTRGYMRQPACEAELYARSTRTL